MNELDSSNFKADAYLCPSYGNFVDMGVRLSKLFTSYNQDWRPNEIGFIGRIVCIVVAFAVNVIAVAMAMSRYRQCRSDIGIKTARALFEQVRSKNKLDTACHVILHRAMWPMMEQERERLISRIFNRGIIHSQINYRARIAVSLSAVILSLTFFFMNSVARFLSVPVLAVTSALLCLILFISTLAHEIMNHRQTRITARNILYIYILWVAVDKRMTIPGHELDKIINDFFEFHVHNDGENIKAISQNLTNRDKLCICHQAIVLYGIRQKQKNVAIRYGVYCGTVAALEVLMFKINSNIALISFSICIMSVVPILFFVLAYNCKKIKHINKVILYRSLSLFAHNISYNNRSKNAAINDLLKFEQISPQALLKKVSRFIVADIFDKLSDSAKAYVIYKTYLVLTKANHAISTTMYCIVMGTSTILASASVYLLVTLNVSTVVFAVNVISVACLIAAIIYSMIIYCAYMYHYHPNKQNTLLVSLCVGAVNSNISKDTQQQIIDIIRQEGDSDPGCWREGSWIKEINRYVAEYNSSLSCMRLSKKFHRRSTLATVFFAYFTYSCLFSPISEPILSIAVAVLSMLSFVAITVTMTALFIAGLHKEQAHFQEELAEIAARSSLLHHELDPLNQESIYDMLKINNTTIHEGEYDDPNTELSNTAASRYVSMGNCY